MGAAAQKVTLDEAIESLTGHEEMAIKRRFGAEVLTLSLTIGGRALVMAFKQRDGIDEDAAYAAVMDMTVGEVDDFFAPEEPELDPDDPETESGKDSGHSG